MDFPTDLPDAFIFVGAELCGSGLGLGAPAAGWLCAVLAVLTAYVPEALGASAGALHSISAARWRSSIGWR